MRCVHRLPFKVEFFFAQKGDDKTGGSVQENAFIMSGLGIPIANFATMFVLRTATGAFSNAYVRIELAVNIGAALWWTIIIGFNA